MKYIDHIADPSRSCAIVAHRGAWHQAPENSLAAIENAIAAGYDIVEVDIRQSADGHLFILHDDTLERMAGIDRAPEEMTIAEITSLRLRMAGGGSDKEMTAHTMEMGVADQVDLKADAGTREQRAWIAGKTGIDGVPFMGKAFFRKENADETAEGIISVSPFMCEAKFDQLETLAGQHDRLKEAGISLWVNTLDPVSCCGFTDSAALRDPDAIWGRMIDAGVSVIQTDEPAALQAYLKARRA
ncbi:glycerophosphodiester phosphodiesterase family protein [Rhizobium leguminosarum]|uniref:glycerophosphodiester phosphodiesterase family protein n=1 Tax=Rhizobium leguminosarum TaxID=384 RepID=UPI001C983CDF|nr:glycerophosphodiester phosphodiesterase family protein [Rhizobium leguminosarum]MBY5768812.1 glycerophosphodiester phosphodiesterase family protein [Rhizobium leguminosarum]